MAGGVGAALDCLKQTLTELARSHLGKESSLAGRESVRGSRSLPITYSSWHGGAVSASDLDVGRDPLWLQRLQRIMPSPAP